MLHYTMSEQKNIDAIATRAEEVSLVRRYFQQGLLLPASLGDAFGQEAMTAERLAAIEADNETDGVSVEILVEAASGASDANGDHDQDMRELTGEAGHMADVQGIISPAFLGALMEGEALAAAQDPDDKKKKFAKNLEARKSLAKDDDKSL